jgi:hypothetical protein
MPTAPGVSVSGGRTKLTERVLRSTTAIVFEVEFTTSAIFRTESIDTLDGPEAGHGAVAPTAAVQIL